jgi:hypothetical protein
MTPREQAEFFACTGSDQEKDAWFFGRLTAKDACRAAWAEKHPTKLFPADIESEIVDGRIRCRFRDPSCKDQLPPVAMTVVQGKVAAFSAFARYVGIGMVILPKKTVGSDEARFRAEAATRAVADALRVTTSDCHVVSLDDSKGLAWIALGSGIREHYPELQDVVAVKTARHQDVMIATTTCESIPHE